MLRCVTVRELSSVLPFCQFCRFLIYISVRFIYISFTLLFTLFFFFSSCQNPAMPFLPCHLRHLWQVIVFKQFFPAKTLAKTYHQCHQKVKSLILLAFLFVKCVMSLLNSARRWIIISSYCLCADVRLSCTIINKRYRKIKNVIKQPFIKHLQIILIFFKTFWKKSLDSLRLLLHNVPINKASIIKKPAKRSSSVLKNLKKL